MFQTTASLAEIYYLVTLYSVKSCREERNVVLEGRSELYSLFKTNIQVTAVCASPMVKRVAVRHFEQILLTVHLGSCSNSLSLGVIVIGRALEKGTPMLRWVLIHR